MSNCAGASAADWEVQMSRAGIPCGMVREVGEAASFAHLADRDALLPLSIPGLPGGRDHVSIVNAGFRMGQDGPAVAAPPPRLGEHTEEIMAWLDEA